MRIAYFSPLRPIPSGISDYSEELLPPLARHVEIDLFVDGYEPANPLIREQFPVYDAGEFKGRQERHPYDAVLYHMGNHPGHLYIYQMMQQYPGVVVLHDSILHHFLGSTFLDERGEFDPYLDAFPGTVGKSLLRRRLVGLWSEVDHFVFPGLERVIACTPLLIVHSQATRRRVQWVAPEAQVQVVPLHVGQDWSPYQGFSPAEVKRRLGLNPRHIVLASFGFVTPSKRFEAILQAYGSFLQKYPAAEYLIVGQDNPHYNIRRLVRDMGLDGLVRITGPVSLEAFCGLIDATDICLQLRYPSAGEMSAALLRTLGKGKPVLVSNYEQFAEIPDDCCLKVDLGPAEVPMIEAYLHLLARDEGLRRRIGENARRYVQRHNTIEQTVQGYLEALEQVARQGQHTYRGGTPMQKPNPEEWIDVPAMMAKIRREIARKVEQGELSPPEQERYQTLVSDWLMEEIRIALAERWHAGELVEPAMGQYHTFGSPPEELEQNLLQLKQQANQIYEPFQVQSQTPLIGKLWASLRRNIHEEVRAYLDPMIWRQSDVNSVLTSSLNMLTTGLYGGSLAQSLQALCKEVSELRQRVRDLEDQLQESPDSQDGEAL